MVSQETKNRIEFNVYNALCPSRQVLNLITDKWTALIIAMLSKEAKRYSQLQREIGGISHKMLSQTLRNLEQRNLVSRKVYSTVPPQVEYSLTTLGESLLTPLAALVDWAETHIAEMEQN